MTLHLYFHPFSSFCQKAVIALHEKELAFEPHVIDLGDPASRAELAALWRFAKFPVLRDDARDTIVPEATLIVEYADALSGSGPALLPADADHARDVRLLDRVCDNYLEHPLQRIVGDRLRPADKRDPHGVAEARALLATTYDLLEGRLGQDGWLAGPDFTLADCAAAPPLFYCARVAPFGADHPRLMAYLHRMLARPSFARAVEEARFFRPFFPADARDAGWPDA